MVCAMGVCVLYRVMILYVKHKGRRKKEPKHTPKAVKKVGRVKKLEATQRIQIRSQSASVLEHFNFENVYF